MATTAASPSTDAVVAEGLAPPAMGTASSSSAKPEERGAKRQKVESNTVPAVGGVYRAHANMQGSNAARPIVACGTTQEYRDAVRRIWGSESVYLYADAEQAGGKPDATQKKPRWISVEVGSAHGGTTQMLARAGAAAADQKNLLWAIGLDMDPKLVKHCREKYVNKKDAGRLFFEAVKVDCGKHKSNPGKFALTEACAGEIRKAVDGFVKQAVDAENQGGKGNEKKEKTAETSAGEGKEDGEVDVPEHKVAVLAIDIAGTITLDALMPPLDALRNHFRPVVTIVKSIHLKQLDLALKNGVGL